VGPRERYALHGDAECGDIELLALVIGTGAAGRSAAAIALDLLDRFGGLDGIAQAAPTSLEAVPGVGAARAVRIHAGLRLGRRLGRPGTAPSPIRSPEDASRVLRPGLVDLVVEELHALYLDRRHRPVALRALTRGTDAFTIVDPRQVFRPAVGMGASAVILAHNHPSGDPTPSREDHDVTDRVVRAGRVIGVGLLDHLVIARGGEVSMASTGVLPPWAAPAPAWTAG
jgi:DNA repair protein RadC